MKCEYCNGDEVISESIPENFEVDIYKNRLFIYTHDDRFIVPINYCPMCGVKMEVTE